MPHKEWKVLVVTDHFGMTDRLRLATERDRRGGEAWHLVHASSAKAGQKALSGGKFDFVLVDRDLGDSDVNSTGEAGQFILNVLKPCDVRFANFTSNPRLPVPQEIAGLFVADKLHMPKVVQQLREVLTETTAATS